MWVRARGGLQGSDPPFAQTRGWDTPEKTRTLKTEGCGTRKIGAYWGPRSERAVGYKGRPTLRSKRDDWTPPEKTRTLKTEGCGTRKIGAYWGPRSGRAVGYKGRPTLRDVFKRASSACA